MKVLLPALFILLTFTTYAQDCDGDRYINNIFTDINVTEDIKYGEGNEINGTFRELYMDIYEPADDTEQNRPVIIMAFGGSFIAGNRKDIDWLCTAYAQKGYVAVSIDYRLYDGLPFPLPTAVQMQEVVIKSVSDFKGAIRHLRQDADNGNTFNINPDIILVGGISAGGIAAAHTAMLDSTDTFEEDITQIIEDNGGLEGNTNNLFEYTTEVQGLINFSGGLASADWIDSEDPAFFSIHDEFDDVVPYEGGFASVFGFDIIYMEGSKSMQIVADSVSVTNELITIDSSEAHVSYFSPFTELATVDYMIKQSSIYAEGIVCELTTSTQKDIITDITAYPNPTSGVLNINSDMNSLYDIHLIDMTDRTNKIWSNTNQIDISEYKNGLYNLRIIDSKGEVRVTQIVLSK